MNADFPRILTLLRKERKISQKQVAADLNISQGLLSHYEKGIRECGLDFLIRCADYFEVSCDYLLGRSPDRTGIKISVDEIPESDAMGKENRSLGGIFSILNKKLIANSLNILFDILNKSANSQLVSDVSTFLMLAVYRMFRVLHLANSKNQSGMFVIPKCLSLKYADSAMQRCEARVTAISEGNLAGCNLEPIADPEKMFITTELLAENYPLFATSLFNLIQNCEKKINSDIK